ncbi:MAG: KHG/KDPG aldolase/sugar kinase fusion protein [Candidatus Aminicenantes bacterium]|jgi:2-dehydro-3-deoxygluconokinase
MNKSEKIFTELKKSRLIALLSPKSAEECVKAYEIFSPEGIFLEIALRTESGLDGIAAVISAHPEALILAGTVLTDDLAESAIKAGAAGVVSADYIPDVVDVCVQHDVMCVPGGLSDAGKQLVHKASAYGCSLEELKERYPYQWVYKLFPAFSGGLSHVELARAWRGPFKDLTVIYTGGLTLETLEKAVPKDPQGIFCASALTKSIDDEKEIVLQIRKWKEGLKPRSSPPEIEKTRVKQEGEPAKAVTFGEMLMRLSPPPGIQLAQARNFDAHFGGAEANVAVGLAQFGLKTFYVTVLPKNELGENACRTLKSFGVDTRFVLRQGKKLGIYYLEHGAGPRPSKVVYDRAHSSISEIQPEDLDWELILDKAVWFHWTGITPALGDSVVVTLREGLETAKKKGITVSCDLNFRKKLWTEDRAREVMTDLVSFVDVLFGNEEDPMRVFGIRPGKSDVEAAKLDLGGYKELAEMLAQRFSLQKVALTLRESVSASENYWSACLFNGGSFLRSRRYHVFVVDRVGAGDAFASGVIAGLIKGKSDQQALEFGVAAACLKHSVRGDFNPVRSEEVERMVRGDVSGRVQR